MFFDQVELKRDGFHAKVQEFVLGTSKSFNNFCPYFWLTVACLIAVPFVAPFKLLAFILMLVGRGFSGLYEILETACLYRHEMWIDRRLSRMMADYSDADAYQDSRRQGRDAWAERRYNRWYKQNKHTGTIHKRMDEEYIRSARKTQRAKELEREERARLWEENREARERAEARLKASVARNKKILNFVVRWIKYPVFIVGGALALSLVSLVLYLLSSGAVWLVTSGWGIKSLQFGLIGVVAVAAAVAVVAGVWSILTCKFVRELAKTNISFLWSYPWKAIKFIFRPAKKPAQAFDRFMYRVFVKIGEAIKFLGLFVKTFKEDNCPGIKWVD